MDGLLQELDDLKFFQELDGPAAAPQKMLGAMKEKPTAESSALYRSRSNGSNGNAANGEHYIPGVIRATVSPTAGSRLPPPPKEPLSPRQISKLDRHSLELETQTLARRVTVLEQEKHALESAVEMYEVTLQDQSQGTEKVRKLEAHLRQVSAQLQQAKKDLSVNREQMITEYEGRLQENIEKLQYIQQQADQFRVERDKARNDLEKKKTEFMERKVKLKEELRGERDGHEARETLLEMQLQEARELFQRYEEKVAELEGDIETLRGELSGAGKALNETKKNRDEAYEVQLTSVKEQLKMRLDKYRRLKEEHERITSNVLKQDEDLEKLTSENDEQASLISDMTERLDAVHAEYRLKFSELKKAYEDKEKRRLDEMVISQSGEVKEYEKRLKALQEQMNHATKRHHAEILQKDEEMKTKLQAQASNLKREIDIEHGYRVHELEEELAVVRQEHEEADSERRRLRRELESAAPREVFAKELQEWEYQDMVREKEMSRLRDKADGLVREVSEKEERITELSSRLSENESKHVSQVSQMEAQHAEVLIARDETLAEEKKNFRAMEMKLRNELTRKETDLEEVSAMMESRTNELRQGLEQTSISLVEARKSLQENQDVKNRTDELQSTYDKLQRDLFMERTRHESRESEMRIDIAKMEGKLRAGESNLKLKRELIEGLEDKLHQATDMAASSTKELQKELQVAQRELLVSQELMEKERSQLREAAETSGSSARELENEIIQVRHELEESKELLEKERLVVKTKAGHIRRLEDEHSRLVEKAERVQELETTASNLQKSLSDVEDEKITNFVALSKLQKDHERLQRRLVEAEEQQKQSKILEAELEMKDRQVSHDSDYFSSTTAELQSQLDQEVKTKNDLIDRLGDIEVEIESKEHQLTRLPKLQSQLREMIKGREELQARLGRVEADLERKERQISYASDRHTEELHDLQKQLDERNETMESLLEQLRSVEAELETKSTRVVKLPQLEFQLEEQKNATIDLQKKLERAEADISKKDKALHEKSDDFSMEYQTKVETLTRSKASLESKLEGLEDELHEREMQVKKTTDRYSSQVVDLQMKVEELTRVKGSLTVKLSNFESELQEKDDVTNKIPQLHAQVEELAHSNADLQRKLDQADAAMSKKEQELISKSGNVSVEFESKVEALTRAKASLESKLRILEEEHEDREKQIKATSERYSNQIVDLQVKVEELTRAKGSMRIKLSNVEAELEQKENYMSTTSSQYNGDVTDLHAKLSDQLEAKEKLQTKLEELERQLARKETELENARENQAGDLQAKLDAEAKETRSLRHRIGDIEAELKRKEKQIKDVVERYSEEIAGLEEKLAVEDKVKSSMQREIGILKNDSDESPSVASLGVSKWIDRVSSLEKSVEVERALARDASSTKKQLEAELELAEKARQDLDERLLKVNGERKEVITALEEVINEVQSREEEIESLASVLRKRDEELEHAKLIATKALASAQEIKARYKEKGSGRHAELNDRVAELHSNLEFLSKKNDNLQRRTSKLEIELQDREMECSELKKQLRTTNSNDDMNMNDEKEEKDPLDDYMTRNAEKNGFTMMDGDGFPSFDSSPSSSHEVGETMSTQSADWLHTFDSASSDSGSGPESAPGGMAGMRNDAAPSFARRNIERDALRKYVRKRYLKSKTTN